MVGQNAGRPNAKSMSAWVCQQQTFSLLLNHLVGAAKQDCWHLQPHRLRRLEIDHQLELGRLLDGQLGRIRPFENLVDGTLRDAGMKL